MPATVVAFGELLVRLTATGGCALETLPLLQPVIGGAEANVAIGLSRLGHATRMVSTVPENRLGEAAIAELRRWGVDVSAVTTGAGRMGLYFLTPGAIHRPSDILYDRQGSAFATARFGRLAWKSLLKGASWLHVSGITAALGPASAAAALKAMRTARDMGVRVAYDGNFRPRLWQAWRGDAPAIIAELMHQADLIFGGRRDMELVLGQAFADEDAAAAAGLAAFPRLQRLVTTHRDETDADHNRLSGLIFTRAAKLATRTYDLSRMVDRIGGGDAFAAGIFHGLLKDESDRRALDYGMACSCLKHAQPGDASLATAADLEAFLSNEGFGVRR